MQKALHLFHSFEEADLADLEYYASLSPQERVDIVLDLIAASIALRAADSLHMALAIAGGAAAMATFDARLAEVSERVGLHTVP